MPRVPSPAAPAPSDAAYCRARCAPLGSNLYYALLFETVRRKRLLHALHAYALEVGEIPGLQKDPGVARLKLQWWQTELARARLGEAGHPVARELQKMLAVQAAAWEQLLQLAVACEKELAAPAPLPPDAARCAHWLSESAAHTTAPPLVSPGLEKLARLLTCYEIILVLPGGRSRPEHGRLKELARDLREARLRVPATERRRQLPGLIMARLAETTCLKPAAADPERAQAHTVPGPVRKLWLAWRIYNQSRRSGR